MATSYSNSGGTGNRTHLITTSFSGITGGVGSAYVIRMLDGVKATGGVQSAWGNTNTAAVLKFDFRAGNTKIIDEFKWYQDVATVNGTWSFAGSNDDSIYTDLATGITFNGSATTTVSFANTTAYRYYKLYQTGGTTSNVSWQEEIEFKIAPGDSSAPSYDNTGGRGDRHLIVTGSDSGLAGGAGAPYAQPMVDGSFVNGTGTSSAWNGAGTAGILTWDFGVGAKKIVNEFSWYQDIDATHGTWKFSGSNDNSGYTDLLTGITLGVTSGWASAAFPVTNTTPYRYYRLTQTGGTTSAASWDREIEFSIKDFTTGPKRGSAVYCGA